MFCNAWLKVLRQKREDLVSRNVGNYSFINLFPVPPGDLITT